MITGREFARISRVLSQFGATPWFNFAKSTYVLDWGTAVRGVPVPEDVLRKTPVKRWPVILAHLEEWGEY